MHPQAASPFFSAATTLSVEDAIAAVQAALAKRQFSVLWHLDINEKLVEKGLPPALPFHVLEVCSAPRAHRALTQNQQVGYLLPCKLVVYEDHATSETRIGVLRPQLMVDLLQDPGLLPLAQEVEAILTEAVHEAAETH